ncbi:MAG: DUF4386 domain-containing protein [Pseudomonadota bacterium]
MSVINDYSEKKSSPASRNSALIAGAGLLAMAVLGGVAIIGGLDRLIDQSSVVQTLSNLTSQPDRFRWASLSVLTVAILDVVVALALWVYFRPASPSLAGATAILRIVYAGVFFFAIFQLFEIWPYLATAISDADHGRIVFDKALRFYLIWDLGLGVFGLHLVLLGVLAIVAPYTPKWIGALLIIAGLGYAIDMLDSAVFTDRIPNVSTVTFVGEIVFMLWLLFLGRNAKAFPGQVCAVGRPEMRKNKDLKRLPDSD